MGMFSNWDSEEEYQNYLYETGTYSDGTQS